MTNDPHLPARRQALPWLAGSLLSGVLAAVVAVRCSSVSHDEPAGAISATRATSAAQTQGDDSRAAAPAPATAAAPSAAASTPAAAAPRDAGAETTIGRLMRVTDEHDRSVLAEIERTTKHAPAPRVFGLLELRRAGKSRAELEAFIQTQLEGGIPVRLAAMKWLRAIEGELEPADGKSVLRKPGEPDVQPRTIKPLNKKAP